VVENLVYQKRLSDAAERVAALLEKVPALDADAHAHATQPDNEDAQ
jgi:hypothetical protein